MFLKSERCVFCGASTCSPAPDATLKQRWVTDGIGATQRLVGGTQPLLCITIILWTHFLPFLSFSLPSLSCSLSLSLPFPSVLKIFFLIFLYNF